MSRDDTEAIRREELSAFVDGALDPERRRALERHLSAHPEDAARVAGYRRRDDKLRLALADMGAPPVEGIGLAWDRVRPPPRRDRRWRALAAAAIILLCVGAGLLWLRHWEIAEQQALASLAHDATVAHLRLAAAPGPETPDLATRLSAALAAATANRARLPDLAVFGFRLVGGLELSTGSGPAVLLVYGDAAGRRLSCYFTRVASDGDTDFVDQTASGIETLSRLDGGIGYAVVGDLAPAELHAIAESGYGGIMD